MSRYKITKVVEDKKNKISRYGTTIYDNVPKSNEDIYVITQAGDRLDNLAFQFYGDQHLWWFIARTNHLKTMNVLPGTRLRIPPSTENAKGR